MPRMEVEGSQKLTTNPQIWNIFIPSELLGENSGLLLGTANRDERQIVIHGITVFRESERTRHDHIGSWTNDNINVDQECRRHSERLSMLGQQLALQLCLNEGGRIEGYLQERCSSSGKIDKHLLCVVLFSPDHVLSSYYLSGNVHSSPAPNAESHHIDNEKILSERMCIGRTIPSLVQSLRNALTNTEMGTSYSTFFHKKCHHSIFQRVMIKLIHVLVWILQCPGKAVDYCTKFLPKFAQSALSTPATAQLLMFRYKTVSLKAATNHHQQISTLLYNSLFLLLIDVLLGVAVCTYMLANARHKAMAQFVTSWAEDVAQELTSLVQWLMGAPAGLKLNAQFTEILGHFFLYHIYLWTGYLAILQSWLPSVMWYLCLTGMLGLTFQLCVIQDVLSMLTLHIYCFYVYAARIFHLQTYTLGSLWRLFRGKKWNVLRARVDTASHNTDRLFVGTLLFTVMLFLLPTTLLYYTVFTLLRLVILFVQGLLGQVVYLFNTTPAYIFWLRVFAPKYVAGGISFRVHQSPQSDEDCLVLRMQTTQLPLCTLRKLSLPANLESSQTHTWSELFTNLATGKLIYPWVDRSTVKHSAMEKPD